MGFGEASAKNCEVLREGVDREAIDLPIARHDAATEEEGALAAVAEARELIVHAGRKVGVGGVVRNLGPNPKGGCGDPSPVLRGLSNTRGAQGI